jgi:hypothetical protein
VETVESDPADTPIVVQIARACDELRIELARRIFGYPVKLRACNERTIGLGR